MDNTQTLFLMHIMDGYSFRNTIGIIKCEIDYAAMLVSENSVEISFLNNSKCAVYKIVLNPKEFSRYIYNIRDENNKLIEEYPIAFETNEMFNSTKTIGRHDGIRLYWLAGDNKINVQPIKSSTKDPGRVGALFVKILTMENKRFDLGTYTKEPNIRIQAKDFADMCSQANSSKCISIKVVGHVSGATFSGIRANQTEAFVNKFQSQSFVPSTKEVSSDMDKIDNLLQNISFNTPNVITNNGGDLKPQAITLNIVNTEDLLTVRMPISTVKALSKIHNISQKGNMLKFTFLENKPLKIESAIGTYGTFTMCIKTPK